MCGFVGSTRPGPGALALAESLAARIAFRGPDGEGAFADEFVAIGHRRLAVLDLDRRGNQPMASAATGAVIAYNGEVYNHLELRASLAPRAWRTGTDTETLLALFDERGADFAPLLRGMFAFALHDPRGGRLHLVRDRLGIKPLFVAKHAGRWFFGSDLRAVAAHPQFPRVLDEGTLRDYLLFGYIPGNRTIWRAARPLPPGTRLEIDLRTGRGRLHRWWDPSDHARPGAIRHEREADEALDALLDESVRLRTLSDAPLGCFLSGGVDSSLVAACLAASGARPLRTFHIGFEEASHDESRHAAAVARHLGAEHHAETFTARDCLDLAPSLADILDQPFADPSVLPTALLARMARRRVVVALSGDGGDELFLGYDRYRWLESLLRRTRRVPPGLRRAAGAIAARMPGRDLPRIGAGLLHGGEREAYGAIVAGWNAPVAGRVLRRRIDFDRAPFHDLAEEADFATPAEAAAYADLRCYLPGDILFKADRATMFHGLEARVPLLDHKIAEFALGLPSALRWDGRGGKPMLRRAAARRLPAKLFDRPKAGFAVPLEHWFRGPIAPLADEHLHPEALGAHGLFDAAAVQRLRREHAAGRRNHAAMLWALLVFQIWFEGQAL